MIPLTLTITAALVLLLGTLWLRSVKGPDALGALLIYLLVVPSLTLLLLSAAVILWRQQGHYITFH